ncbi:MAG: type 4a pilus biogenesis protein PilO [Gemmatimonadaceae bacterium]|nr:type 4a pilus biogenesis protein PilO [Gemmatimonadaceae bacterium]
MAFPPKTQREQAMVLVCVVAAMLASSYWNFVYKPKSEELTELRSRVDTLEKRNNVARSEAAEGKGEQLRAEADQFGRDLEVMRQLVPTGNEVPALLEQVSTAARRAGLDISAVTPAPVVEGEQFDTYRYQIAVTGGYHAVAEFLANVGSLTRIMAPVNVSLAVAGNTNLDAVARRPVGSSALDTKFEIQTYVARTATVTRGGKS